MLWVIVLHEPTAAVWIVGPDEGEEVLGQYRFGVELLPHYSFEDWEFSSPPSPGDASPNVNLCRVLRLASLDVLRPHAPVVCPALFSTQNDDIAKVFLDFKPSSLRGLGDPGCLVYIPNELSI